MNLDQRLWTASTAVPNDTLSEVEREGDRRQLTEMADRHGPTPGEIFATERNGTSCPLPERMAPPGRRVPLGSGCSSRMTQYWLTAQNRRTWRWL
jgi:hypothetical protein